MFSSIGNTDEYISGAIAPAALRLFLPRRYCEQSSIILASCESNSLPVFLTHVLRPHKTFPFGDIVCVPCVIILCVVKNI